MTSLESYLRGPYKEDRVFLSRLLNSIEEVIPLFYKQTVLLPDGSPGRRVITWPYAFSDKKGQEKSNDISYSTHCMILFALDSFAHRGKDEHSLLLGKNFRPCKLSGSVIKDDEVKKVIADAKHSLLIKLGAPASKLHSTTYGTNDPFTLTWLTEIVFRMRPEELKKSDDAPELLDACKRRIREAAKDVLSREGHVLHTGDEHGAFKEVSGAFLELRRLHLVQTLANIDKKTDPDAVKATVLTAAQPPTSNKGQQPVGNEGGPAAQPTPSGRAANSPDVTQASNPGEWLDKNTPVLWAYFDSTIHRQLSYSAMGDPKFDPAELAFAFEGALLLHPTWVSPQTIGKVFDALALSRDRHPYWRPGTPFLANSRGHVLFLVSVEVANSILRACEILDEEEARPATFSRFEPHLREYAQWLFGEMEEVAEEQSEETNLYGWRTDYEERRDTIQLWHTSHVLVFLSHYASLLTRKIAADGIDAAGLMVRAAKEIKKIRNYWEQEPLPSLAVGVEERQYAVLSRIKKHYIEPRQPRARAGGDTSAITPLYSMLLFGPPGTGKTTVAEQLAATLGTPLIVVTVSDFLAAGAADVENRAKGVFQVLRAQVDVVILFDEIDQFLLDRNSEFYREQDDVFKFMTPGMLTKLQDLRDARNCVFVVATNYYERIDSAIKRRGRIDEHFLLSIPDCQQRLSTIEFFTREVFAKAFQDEKKRGAYEKEAGDGGSKREFLDYVSGYRVLRERDLKNPQALADELLDGKKPLSHYLRKELFQKAKLRSEENDSSDAQRKKITRTLLEGLNKLEGASLYDEQRFEGVELTDKIRRLIAKKPQGEELMKLNRLLLEVAYPDEIKNGFKGIRSRRFEAAIKKARVPREEGRGAQGERGEDEWRTVDVLTETALFGWGDLKNLVESRTDIVAGMDLESFARALAEGTDKVESAVSLASYRSRFGAGGSDPIEEFLLLLYLVAEAKAEVQKSDLTAVQNILKSIREAQTGDYEYLQAIKDGKARRVLQDYMEAPEGAALQPGDAEEDNSDKWRGQLKDFFGALTDALDAREKAKSNPGGDNSNQ